MDNILESYREHINEKDKWVLVKSDTESFYSIINAKNHFYCIIENDEVAAIVIEEMLKTGSLVFSSIEEAYSKIPYVKFIPPKFPPDEK